MKKQTGKMAAFLFAAIMSVADVSGAQTYYADWNNGNDENDGLSAAKAFKSFEKLVKAVNGTGDGSIGILAEGEYLLASCPTCTVAKATFKAISGNRDKTVINGQGQYRCFYTRKNNTTIANLTFRRGFLNNPGSYGNGDGNGAGVYASNRSVNMPGGYDSYTVVTNCVFDSCTNICSGSALVIGGGSTVVDCVFTNCWTSTDGGSQSGDNGGGASGGTVFVLPSAANDTLFDNCVFADNGATYGSGGISSGLYSLEAGSSSYTNYPGIVLKDCDFLRNRTDAYGGAIKAKVREAIRCNFVSNYAALGSGAFTGLEVYKRDASINAAKSWTIPYTNKIIDCTFIGNSSGGYAGAYSPGMYSWACISNCTFIGNSSAKFATIYMGRRGVSVTMLGFEIHDSVFKENSSLSDDGDYCSLMYSSIKTPSLVQGSLFVSNETPSWASCVLLGSNSVVRNSIFIGNRIVGNRKTGENCTSRFGGAVFFEGGNCRVENSLFVGNTNRTSSWGCGINANGNNNAGRGNKVFNCTFARNGAGVMFGVHGSGVTAAKMEGVATVNCLFWENVSLFGGRNWTFFGCTNCYANTTVFENSSAGNIYGNSPRFTDSDAGDWTLGANSPCKNAGFNCEWMKTAKDLAGNPRIDCFTGIVDIGCYESIAMGMNILIR